MVVGKTGKKMGCWKGLVLASGFGLVLVVLVRGSFVGDGVAACEAAATYV